MEIYYINSANKKINFKKTPYKTRTANLLDVQWDYQSEENRIKCFHRSLIERNIELDVITKDKDEYYDALNNLIDIIDYDNGCGKQGKLYINEYYLSCNIIASEKTMWESGLPLLQNRLTVLIAVPIWIKESTFSFSPSLNQKEITNSKKFTYSYPYQYGGFGGKSYILNQSVTNVNMQIMMYGPCDNPAINIAGKIYQVFGEVESGERLEINTKERSVFLIKRDGSKLCKFNQRSNYLFEKLSIGKSDVIWNDSFKFDIIIFDERSEPKWR